jgi:putative ABC transport system permease protein
MRLWTLAVCNLARRPARSSLTALGIAVAVGCFLAIIGLSRGLEHAWVNNLMARGTHLLATQKGAVEMLTTSLDAGVGERLRAVEGVADVAGELCDMMTLESDHMTLAQGWMPGGFLSESIRLVEGRLPEAGEPNAVALGEAAAESLHKRLGDPLRLRDRTFTVVGLFRTKGVLGNNSVVLPLETLQEMMQRKGKVTVFHVRVDRPEDPGRLAAVQARLREAMPDLTFVETSAVTENNLIYEFFRTVAWSMSLIAIVIALVVVLNTLLMSVLERTHEIGVLSALGWPARRIEAMIVLEGLLLSLAGGAAGLAIGLAGLRWLTSLPRLRGLIEPEVSARLLLEVVSAVLVLGVLGSLYPAWRASRLNTVDALRYE